MTTHDPSHNSGAGGNDAPTPPEGSDHGAGELSASKHVAPGSWWKSRQLIGQLLGFVIGAALLWWCIDRAIADGDWSAIGNANPWLIIALAGCTIISVIANGAIFWLTIRPLQPLRFSDLQMVNISTSVLNYAPIRLGLIARLAYHLRVDRIGVVRLGGWMAAVAYTMALGIAAAFAATLMRGRIDWVWALLLIALLIVAGLITMFLLSRPLIVRHARGMDQMLRHPTALWGALTLRIVDIAAFTGRMAIAVAILPDIDLPLTDVCLLAVSALALTMNPLGRFGFREAGVAIIAEMLISSHMDASAVEGQIAQLSLIESAGEAMVIIPLGAIAMLWYRAKWRAAAHANVNT